jgi:hypothetical protein
VLDLPSGARRIRGLAGVSVVELETLAGSVDALGIDGERRCSYY